MVDLFVSFNFSLNNSGTSEASVAVRCLGPANGTEDKLQVSLL